MKYDFDKVIERRGTGALKTDALAERYGRPDLQGLWVADMDFATPPFIIDALRERLSHPVLGYTVEPADYRPSIIDWQREHHGWDISPEWLSYIPGIVKGIGMAINVFTRPGEGIVIQPPVYHIFKAVIEGNGRRAIDNPLLPRPTDGLYDMDLDGLERTLAANPDAKMLILSNPHNPAGIVWSPDTLRRLAAICARAGVIVISDEIHADMTLFGHRHTPFASVSPEAANCSITFGAPSKVFNIPGVVTSYSIISNPALRERFYSWLVANELGEPDIFAPIASIAAYRKGEEWRREMLAYVEENILAVERFCRERLAGKISAVRPEASFLLWLDCRALGLDTEGLRRLFVDRAGLALNDGAMFGPGGEGYMRLNVAAPRRLIMQAMEKLAACL